MHFIDEIICTDKNNFYQSIMKIKNKSEFWGNHKEDISILYKNFNRWKLFHYKCFFNILKQKLIFQLLLFDSFKEMIYRQTCSVNLFALFSFSNS
jgi:hypothetical protein